MDCSLIVLTLTVLLSGVVDAGKLKPQNPDNVVEVFQQAWRAVATTFSAKGPEESVAKLSKSLCTVAATKAAMCAHSEYIKHKEQVDVPTVSIDLKTILLYKHSSVQNLLMGYKVNESKDKVACEAWMTLSSKAFSSKIRTKVGIGAFEFLDMGKAYTYVIILLKSGQSLPVTKQGSDDRLDFMSGVDRDKITNLFYAGHFQQIDFKDNTPKDFAYLVTDDFENIGETGIDGRLIIVWKWMFTKVNEGMATLQDLVVYSRFQESFKVDVKSFVGDKNALYGFEVLDETWTKKLFSDYKTALTGGFLLCFIQRPNKIAALTAVQPNTDNNTGPSNVSQAPPQAFPTTAEVKAEVSPQAAPKTSAGPPQMSLLDTPVPSVFPTKKPDMEDDEFFRSIRS